MKLPRHLSACLLTAVVFWILSPVLALAANTTFDFESVVSLTTSFTISSQTWTLTGNMETVIAGGEGAPAVGSPSPESNGFLDTGFLTAHSGNVGGIKAPTGFTFRAVSFDVWPSADTGNDVFEGGNASAGTVGLSYQLIGKRNGSQVCTATVKDTLLSPPENNTNNAGGYWHHLDLSSTAFATTDIDTVEFVLVAQTQPPIANAGDVMNYIAVDNFTYSNFGAAVLAPTVTGISPTPGPAGSTVTISGTNFTGATAVMFGTTAATSFTVNSANSITATVPAGTGTVDVIVTNGVGSSPATAADQFTYGPGVATHFAVNAATPATAGNPLSFTVTALDQFNNVATGYTGTIHFTKTDSGAGSALPANYPFVPGDNGVHTFTNGATMVTAGPQTLTVTDTGNGTITGTSNTITVNPANATHLAILAPGTATAGVVFSMVVTAQDPFNNTATGYRGTVHFTKSDSGIGSAVPADYTFVAGDNGVHTFTNSVTMVTAATQTVSATDTVNSSITSTSNNVAVSPNIAIQLVVTHQPSPTATAGQAFASQPMVALEDTFGNVISNDSTHTVTVARGSHGGASLQGSSLTVTVNNGVATFSGLSYNTAETMNLSFTTNAGAFSTTSNDIVVSGAAATHFSVSAQGSTTAGVALTFAVIALDQFNNIAAGYRGTAHFTKTDSGAGSAPPTDYPFVAGDNGMHIFSNSTILVTAGSQTLAATDTTNGSITGTSNTITVSAAAATHLAISAPGTATAGNIFGVVVTALDPFNNTATSFNGAVSFNSTDGQALLPGSATLNNGQGSVNVTLKTAGNQTVTATGAGLTAGVSNNVAVSPNIGSQLVVTRQPSPTATAGQAFATQPMVAEEDAFNNVITTDNTSAVTVARGSKGTSALQGSSKTVTLNNGVATFSGLFYDAAETMNLNFTSSSGGVSPTTSNDIVVSGASATHFLVSAQGSTTAGSPFSVTVTAQDQFNNTAIGYLGAVHFTKTDSGAGSAVPADYPFVAGDNGTHTFTNGAILVTAGSWTLAAADTANGSITGTSNNILVSAAAATHLAVSAPGTATAGNLFGVLVTALDPFNNTATGYNGAVNFGSTDGQAILPGSTLLNNGQGSANVTLKTAGNQTVTATGAGLNPGTSNNIAVSGGMTTHFTVTAPGSVTSGTAFNFTITALDAFNNTTTNYSGTVQFTSTDGSPTLPPNSTLSSGTGTFSATLNTPGTQTITGTDTTNSSITGTSNSVTVGEGVRVAASTPNAVVGGANGAFTFTRGSTTGALIVNFQLDSSSTSTAAHFALSGDGVSFDPVAGVGAVTIPNGSTSVAITLTASNPNGMALPAQTVELDVTSGTGYAIGSPSNATVTIAQNGFVVFNANDNGAGSLRQAVLNANAATGSPTITFDPSVTSAITLTSGELAVTHGMTVKGPAGVSGSANSRIFDITSGTVVISGLAMTNGNSTAVGSNGGAIYVNAANVSLTNCTLSGNTATAAGASGGALAIISGTLAMNDCTVSGNTATGCSGIYVQDSSAAIVNTTISGNSGPLGDAIHLLSLTANCSITLQNCTVTGNTVSLSTVGSALTFQAMTAGLTASATLTNCTVSGNTSTNPSGQGAIFAQPVGGGATSLVLYSTIVSGNTAGGAASDIAGITVAGGSGNNLIGTGGGLFNGSNGNIVGFNNPLLGPLENNGGLTQTMLPSDGSPAINAGGAAAAGQEVTVSGTSGAYSLSYNGQPTTAMAFNASLAQVTASLASLPTIGAGNVIVIGWPSDYTVIFTGALAGNSAPITANASGGAVVHVAAYDQRGPGFPRVVGSSVDIGAVEALLYTPTVTSATTLEDTQSTSGLVITANPADGGGTTNYQITGITNGTLFQNDGTTPINNGDFITTAQGAAGLKFTPGPNLNIFASTFGFSVQAAVNASASGLRGSVVTATITVTPVADTPSVTNASTTENTQTTSGLVISRNPVDGSETAYFKITNIQSGTLYLHDGVTPVINNSYITYAQGNAGLKFTPANNFLGVATFLVQGSDDNVGTGLSATTTASITVGTANPTPAQVGTTAKIDPQTGLFDLTVNVTNTTPFAINGFRLYLDLSAYLAKYPSLRLYNATGSSGSQYYVDYPYPVAVGATIPVNLEFYTSNRQFPSTFTPAETVTTLSTSETAQPNPQGIQITHIVKQTNGNILLEFPSIVHDWYRITYSNDLTNWFDSQVPIQASGTQTQWIDNGAPLTSAPPSTVKSRFYYVRQIPTP
jgi:hypothetical protein